MNLSAKIIIATVVILIVYDIWAAVKWGPPGTLSVTSYRAAKKYPAVPFWAGILIGHLFVSQITYLYDISKMYPFIAFCGGYICSWAFMADNRVNRFARAYPAFPFISGVIAGNLWASLIL